MEQTLRKPDYYNDIEKYGKFGEELFVKLFSNKLQIVDVRMNKKYQIDDIDFLVARENEEFKAVEVKVDCAATGTGNLAYEVVSHGCNGWAVLTKADYVFMIIADGKYKTPKPSVAYWIDMNEWRKYCSRRDTKKHLHEIKNECIVDIICKIDDLRDAKVIKSEIFL